MQVGAKSERGKTLGYPSPQPVAQRRATYKLPHAARSAQGGPAPSRGGLASRVEPACAGTRVAGVGTPRPCRHGGRAWRVTGSSTRVPERVGTPLPSRHASSVRRHAGASARQVGRADTPPASRHAHVCADTPPCADTCNQRVGTAACADTLTDCADTPACRHGPRACRHARSVPTRLHRVPTRLWHAGMGLDCAGTPRVRRRAG